MKKMLWVALAATSACGSQAQPAAGWQACAAVGDAGERLVCYDRWAAGHAGAAVAVPAPSPPDTAPDPRPLETAKVTAPPGRTLRLTAREGCRDERYSALSR